MMQDFLKRVMEQRLAEQMEAAKRDFEARQCPDCGRRFRNLRKDRCSPCEYQHGRDAFEQSQAA